MITESAQPHCRMETYEDLPDGGAVVFFDTETCGLHGPIVLIQYAIGGGPIQLFEPWHEPIERTIELIESFAQNTIVGFNLTFDWFHMIQMYTTLIQFEDRSITPIDHIVEYAVYEKKARDLDITVKPHSCFDLMLHARKGPYQSTMDRKDIVIKRVPTPLAWELARELDSRIPLSDVYFAKKEDPTKRWTVLDVENELGPVPDFKNVALKFAPSSALKALASDVLGISALKFMDIEPHRSLRPVERGYAPYALAPFMDKKAKRLRFPGPDNWHGKWPAVIKEHIAHWRFHSLARQYAEDDVKYTRLLYERFEITPDQHDDTESTLACMAASVRWRGFKVNRQQLNKLKEQSRENLGKLRFNFKSKAACRGYLSEVLSETEMLGLSYNGRASTKKTILEELSRWTKEILCPDCNGFGENCGRCLGRGTIGTEEKHPAAIRAKEILDARIAEAEIALYDKILTADRFHASVNIIGARSGRQSGADGLNAQGINHAKVIRECFTFAWDGFQLTGGDFAGSQVAIADAVYNDPKLRADLQSGKKLYTIFGLYLFPGMSYEEITESKGSKVMDYYDRAKKGVLAMLFGGTPYTLATKVGITEEAADAGYQQFVDNYRVWGDARAKDIDTFCSMRQPGGIGSKVVWADPPDYVESMFGFRRYFTLENKITRALFDLANKPPRHWQTIKIKVMRRDREQTAGGAVQSALYAAAFAQQAANMRAAANHKIQSPEATIVKTLQRRIWDLQPFGVNTWRVQPLNIHDELMNPTRPDYVEKVRKVVNDLITEYRAYIPLMDIEWYDKLESWADK